MNLLSQITQKLSRILTKFCDQKPSKYRNFVKICNELVKKVKNMVSQTGRRVRFNSWKGPVYPGKGPEKSQWANENFGANKCYLGPKSEIWVKIWNLAPKGPTWQPWYWPILSLVCGFHRHDQSRLYGKSLRLPWNATFRSCSSPPEHKDDNPVCRLHVYNSHLQKVKPGCVLAPTLFGIIFSAFLTHAFPEEDGVMIHICSRGRLFNLSRLRAKTKTRRVLIRELLYADDAALVAFRAALAIPTRSLRRGLHWLQHDHQLEENCLINVNRYIQSTTHSHQRLTAYSLSTNSLVWDLLLSTLPIVWTTNELERLSPTSGDSVLGFATITTSQSNLRSCAARTSSSLTWLASKSLHIPGKHLLPATTDGVPPWMTDIHSLLQTA